MELRGQFELLVTLEPRLPERPSQVTKELLRICTCTYHTTDQDRFSRRDTVEQELHSVAIIRNEPDHDQTLVPCKAILSARSSYHSQLVNINYKHVLHALTISIIEVSMIFISCTQRTLVQRALPITINKVSSVLHSPLTTSSNQISPTPRSSTSRLIMYSPCLYRQVTVV